VVKGNTIEWHGYFAKQRFWNDSMMMCLDT